MSKDNKAAAPEENEPPKKSKKLLILALALVMVLVLVAVGVVMMLKGGGEDEEGVEEEEEVVVEKEKPKKKEKKKDHGAPPVFVPLDAFTVNLIPEEAGDQYLQVILSLELEDAEAETALKGQMPKIRNDITIFLSGKKASELITNEGKLLLAEHLRDKINVVLNPPVINRRGQMIPPDGPVLAVLFTSFIIQ